MHPPPLSLQPATQTTKVPTPYSSLPRMCPSSLAAITLALAFGVAPAARAKYVPLEGWPVQNFSVTTVEGKVVSRETSMREVTVLDFVAPNCEYSKRQIADIERVRRRYAAGACRFVLVSEVLRDERFTDAQIMERFLTESGFGGELVIDKENHLGRLFHAHSYPTVCVVSRDAKPYRVMIGATADLDRKLSTVLDDLGVPRVARPAPTFKLKSASGEDISNATVRGAVTVFTFLAPESEKVAADTVAIEKVREEYGSDDCRFIAVPLPPAGEAAEKAPTRDALEARLRRCGEPAVDKDGAVATAFLATHSPCVVLLEREGRIERELVGPSEDLARELTAALTALGVQPAKPPDSPGRITVPSQAAPPPADVQHRDD